MFKKKTEEAVKRTRETWFGKITRLFERSSIEKETWEELEELLIAADTGVDTATTLTQRVKERVSREKISDAQQARTALMQEMALILKVNGNAPAVTASPRVVLVVGVNGSGKTTSIAKLGYSFKRDGNKVMLAAADTFRAAAIDQLKWWGERIEAEVIAHQQGADPGAVVFDALQAAKNRGVQVVIVDTAGRLHTKFNLMEELKKIRRVIQRIDPSGPHETLLVLDATTGQNGLNQAKHFTEAVGVSGIILTKLDSTAKGGIVLAICDQLKIPVRFIGTGEKLDDLAPFDPQTFVEAIMS
ncbi:MAG: signal recognition particle-docking protein FtsY [Chloroflexi bacterium]|nr:signal recognition particle-docking protein FtsY [Chloroflexota bacterium]